MCACKKLKRCYVPLKAGVYHSHPWSKSIFSVSASLPSCLFFSLLSSLLRSLLTSPNWPQVDILISTLNAFSRQSEENGYLWFCFVWGKKPDLLNLLVVLCRLRTDYKNHLKSGQQKSCKQNEYLLMIINKNQILKCNDFSKIRPLKMDFQNLSGPEGKCVNNSEFFNLEWKSLR